MLSPISFAAAERISNSLAADVIPIVAATCDMEASKPEPTEIICCGICAAADEAFCTTSAVSCPRAVFAIDLRSPTPFSKPELSTPVPNVSDPSKNANFLTSQKRLEIFFNLCYTVKNYIRTRRFLS